jgi:hypothetical protein
VKPTKLPQDWQPDDFDRQYAKDRGFTDGEIDDVADDFTTYWTLGMGRNKTHLAWSGSGRSAWATWVRRTNPKTKPVNGFQVRELEPEEAERLDRRRRLTEIITKRKKEVQYGWNLGLSDNERAEADRHLGEGLK